MQIDQRTPTIYYNRKIKIARDTYFVRRRMHVDATPALTIWRLQTVKQIEADQDATSAYVDYSEADLQAIILGTA